MKKPAAKDHSKPFAEYIQFAHVLLVFSSRPRWAYNGHDLATEFTGFWNLTMWNERAGQMIRYVLACIRDIHNRNGHRTPIQTTTMWLLTKHKFC